MGYRDIWPYASSRGGTLNVYWAPMNASEAFVAGEPIFVNADGEAATFPKDGTEMLLADANAPYAAGIAINGPGTAATAELIAADGWRTYTHPDTGNTYATGDKIWYVPFAEGNLFVTQNVVAAAGGSAGAAFTGADRGDDFQITYVSGTTPDLGWGLERTAGAAGTDYVATIIDVLDANGRSVSATGTGVFAVFKVTV